MSLQAHGSDGSACGRCSSAPYVRLRYLRRRSDLPINIPESCPPRARKTPLNMLMARMITRMKKKMRIMKVRAPPKKKPKKKKQHVYEGNDKEDEEKDDGDDIDGDGDDGSDGDHDDSAHDSNVEDGAIWKRSLCRHRFTQPFSAPPTSTNLPPPFRIIGRSRVFAFSRNTDFAAGLHSLSSRCFLGLVP